MESVGLAGVVAIPAPNVLGPKGHALFRSDNGRLWSVAPYQALHGKRVYVRKRDDGRVLCTYRVGDEVRTGWIPQVFVKL